MAPTSQRQPQTIWMDCKHKKFGDEWKIISSIAISEDTD